MRSSTVPVTGWSTSSREVGSHGQPPFPSGHAASAFAFAYAVGRHLPVLAVPIRLLAAGVAYSRVHIGVRYPGDVVIGSIVGAGPQRRWLQHVTAFTDGRT
jgi:membrane-associated phospholipid phosphatase